jgi:hypothetical protein
MLAYYGPEWESLASRIVDRWTPSLTGNTQLQLPSTMGRSHGTLINFSNNGNDAYVSNLDKLALNFDATNDYAEMGVLTAIDSGDVSFSFWYYPHVVTGAGTIFNNWSSTVVNRGFYCFRTGSQIAFQQPTSSHRVTTNLGSLTAATWHHIVCAKASIVGGLRVYINGVLDGNSATAGGDQSSTARFNFGGNYGGTGGPNCLMDDLVVFNAALTANEVRFIYDQGRGGGLLLQPPRRRSVAAVIAALVLACETAHYSLTGQAAGLFASRVLAADQAQYILSGNAANITASRLLSADPASYTATGSDAATICARLLDGGAAAYALTGTDAGLIANRKLTADQAVYFLAGNNAELLRSLKLNAGSMALQLDNFAASLLADRKISADGAQYILVVSDANLGDSASGVAPYYYLFMLRGPQ